LRALDVKAGDAVICPSFTFAATAEVVALAKAEPVFVDVEPDSYNIDIDSLEAAMGQGDQEAVMFMRQGLLQVLSLLGYEFGAVDE
jgi:dTDP-4-amino-4,6-dideoxygalactose transaminase